MLRPLFISRCTRNKTLILLACYVVAFTVSCTHSNGKNYFPLADSAKWEYAGRSLSSDGKHISFHATARVDGETLINGKRYFKHITSSDLQGLEHVRYYRVAEDGIYFRLGNDPDRPELLEMPLPIPIGAKWLSDATEVQAERAGTVTVGGREYRDCLKLTYRQQGVSRSLENYLASDVGVIKVVDVSNTEPKSTVELTLEKYQP
jgi:hypothetical protein